MTKTSTMASPWEMPHPVKKVAILFAGGPAPGANAVISTAATAFLRHDIEAVGIKHGYSQSDRVFAGEAARRGPRLRDDHAQDARPHAEFAGDHHRHGPHQSGQECLAVPTHLDDAERVKPLKTVYEALRSIGVDALISIGGDDTLKTANKFKLYQEKLPADAPADSGRAFAEDDRQRLPRHRLHVRLLHGRRLPGPRGAESDRRRGSQPGVLSRRVDGPQRRLAGVRRGDRRRGEPRDQRRRHRRPVRNRGRHDESEDRRRSPSGR